MTETQPYKNYFGTDLARDLALRIQAVYPQFHAESFVQQVAAQVDELELKARVALIADALHAHLPASYLAALDILHAILGPELSSEEGMFNEGYYLMPVAYFVEVYGQEHFDESLAALYEITRRHTAEWNIRPFLAREPQRMLALLHQWAHDDNVHVRRLVSEGTRPRLPWAARLQMFVDDPAPLLHLLAELKNDPSPYVRKSVANNLNDIIKDHPDLVLEHLTEWQSDAAEATLWIIRHALRNLVKQGDPRALRLLGIEQPQVSLQDLTLQPDPLRQGESLALSFALQSESAETQTLVVDYLIHFVKASGKTSPKVFKLSKPVLPAGERLHLRKQHSFKPVTTRRYYAGQHRLEVQINGQILGGADFVLEL